MILPFKINKLGIEHYNMSLIGSGGSTGVYNWQKKLKFFFFLLKWDIRVLGWPVKVVISIALECIMTSDKTRISWAIKRN